MGDCLSLVVVGFLCFLALGLVSTGLESCGVQIGDSAAEDRRERREFHAREAEEQRFEELCDDAYELGLDKAYLEGEGVC